MTATRTSRRLPLSVGVLASVVAAAALTSPAAHALTSSDTKVRICHATNATTNPYRSITVAESAVNGAGRGDHYSTHTGSLWVPGTKQGSNWGDIIPPIPGIHDGLNWTPAG